MYFTNFPIIFPLCDIANLFECVAMFYFVKRLTALRIVTEPRTDCILLFGRFPVLLHHALDVGSFGRGKERLVLTDGLVFLRRSLAYRLADVLLFIGLLFLKLLHRLILFNGK